MKRENSWLISFISAATYLCLAGE